jgi:hypothetical protein
VDSYFYISKQNIGFIKNWNKFPYEYLFEKIYIQRLIGISFNDIQPIYDKNTKEIQYIMITNQLRVIEDDVRRGKVERIITFFPKIILQLPTKLKHSILQNVMDYFYHLYLSPATMGITISLCLHTLIEGIHQFLSYTFVDERDNETRKFMIVQLDKISQETKKQKNIKPYDTRDFICRLPLNYDDITNMIIIADMFLSMHRIDLVETLIRSYIQEFIDIVIDTKIIDNRCYSIDSYADDIYYQLQIKYSPTMTYDDKLSQLIEKFDPQLYHDFYNALYTRSLRYKESEH